MTHRRYRRWTHDDEAHLRQLTRTYHDPTRIAAGLKRSPSAVIARISHLGGWRKLRRGLRIWDIVGVCRLLGLDDYTVRALVRDGYLHAHQPGWHRPARVTERDLTSFLTDRRAWPAWSVGRITDTRLKVFADTQRRLAGGSWLTAAQAAQQLGWSRSQINRWLLSGVLPGHYLLGQWYVWSTDAAAFVPPARRVSACVECGGERMANRRYCPQCYYAVWRRQQEARNGAT